MSRYEAANEAGDKFVYGFDRVLRYYFLDKVYPGGDWEHVVGLLSCPEVYGSAVNLLEYLDKFAVIIPVEHRQNLEFDLPI